MRVFGEMLRSDLTGSGRTEEGRKDESGGQLSTVHHRTRAGGNEFKSRGDKDGRSRAGGSERSEEPQTETRGEVSNISSEVVATSTHWGQRVVYWAGTLQIHCKDMDRVPTIYRPGHWKYIQNFPS